MRGTLEHGRSEPVRRRLEAFNSASGATLVAHHDESFPFEVASDDVAVVDRELVLADHTGGFELVRVEVHATRFVCLPIRRAVGQSCSRWSVASPRFRRACRSRSMDEAARPLEDGLALLVAHREGCHPPARSCWATRRSGPRSLRQFELPMRVFPGTTGRRVPQSHRR
jgi:hypothetical protein